MRWWGAPFPLPMPPLTKRDYFMLACIFLNMPTPLPCFSGTYLHVLAKDSQTTLTTKYG